MFTIEKINFIFTKQNIMLLNAMVDTILVFGAVIMTDSYTKKTDSKTRKIMTVGGLALVVFLFSVILSIFKSKAHGYPYRYYELIINLNYNNKT